jgi:hypothetical protein
MPRGDSAVAVGSFSAPLARGDGLKPQDASAVFGKQKISVLGFWLGFLKSHLDQPADCFRSRWPILLLAAPSVHGFQKIVRRPHLEGAVLNASRWAAHKCVDLYYRCHYIYKRAGRRVQAARKKRGLIHDSPRVASFNGQKNTRSKPIDGFWRKPRHTALDADFKDRCQWHIRSQNSIRRR